MLINQYHEYSRNKLIFTCISYAEQIEEMKQNTSFQVYESMLRELIEVKAERDALKANCENYQGWFQRHQHLGIN